MEKRLEDNEKVKERLEENPEIEKKDFTKLLQKAVKPSSKQSVSTTP